MNSEAQRARNKRKRDKLREKKRQATRGGSILRLRLDALVHFQPVRCHLLVDDKDKIAFSSAAYQDVSAGIGSRTFSTEWVYMSTHDVSSSVLDAIECFFNTVRECPACHVANIVLIMQLDGTERRKVWQGHTMVDAQGVRDEVCSFVSQRGRKEFPAIPCTVSQ